jgi:tetratricopeptide (TPR) repeat protein
LNFYEEILSKFSTDSNACKRIADNFRLGGNYEAALKYYDRALELDSVNVWAWYDKGQTLEQLGQYEKALHAVLEADKLLHPQDNNRTWVHSGLGKLYLQLGHKSQAKEQFETALRYNGKNHVAREGLKKV